MQVGLLQRLIGGLIVVLSLAVGMSYAPDRPVQTLVACLFFGLTEAITIQMQGVVKLPSGEDIPVQFIQMVPYILTMVVLAGFIGHSRPPRALGRPYEKER